jgi:murein DD-endopeptidase MepM/ murein hydrolase activator NlpD
VRRWGLLVFLLGGLSTSVWAQERYPVIHRLDTTDIVFRQLEDDISQYHVAIQTGKTPPALLFYAYYTQKGEDLFGLAAQLNLPYDTLATLNGLSHSGTFAPKTRIIIANTPGIFVPQRPQTELEYLMASWRREAIGNGTNVTVYNGSRAEGLSFYPGQRFHPVERAFFLGILFRFPLPKGVITSPFGMRMDPFTHVESFHSGVDIGAPYGTDVYAARGGRIEKIGVDREYGNYILIQHEGGYQTLYGHLSAVLVQLNERVASGMIIGKVGSTGMSTGPHLHFEIRRNGRPEDPLPLLPKGGG